MPTAPYLLFGFDVDATNPNALQIHQAVEADFPIDSGIGSVGVENVYYVEVPPSQAIGRYKDVVKYLQAKDAQFGGELRWFVQLCESAYVSLG